MVEFIVDYPGLIIFGHALRNSSHFMASDLLTVFPLICRQTVDQIDFKFGG